MAGEKVTEMRLKVDLQCPCCYKKIKKILCKFPQIRDQVYDEKNNIVKIVVVCCSPEKIRDKLCCKGGKVIKSIDIVEPAPVKPKDPVKPKGPEKPKETVKPKGPEKPKETVKPKDPEKPKETVKPKESEKPKEKPKETPKAAPAPVPVPVPDPKPCTPPPTKVPVPTPNPPLPEPVPVSVQAYPIGVCCRECYEGRPGGPCYQGYGYGRPVPPPPCYDNYGYQYGYGYSRGCNVSRCDQYTFSDENPSACSIM